MEQRQSQGVLGDMRDAYVKSPPDDVYYRRRDADDPRLGQSVGRGLASYDSAQVVIVGCPQDDGVRRNDGRGGAHLAPTEIRRALYRFPSPAGDAVLPICDLGDIVIQPSLEDTHRIQYHVVRQIIGDGKRAIILGGGNDVSYPDVKGLAAVEPHLMAFNVDSHFDVRQGDERTSGTPYRQLLEEGLLLPERFYEIGCKPEVNAVEHQRYLERQGAHIVWLTELRQLGVASLIRDILRQSDASAIFWGFDIDAVRSSDAPGVSASYPVGLTAEELCVLADAAGSDRRTRIIEISEINPKYDVDGRTSRLAAQVIARALRALRPEL